jgi:hypothetical protein
MYLLVPVPIKQVETIDHYVRYRYQSIECSLFQDGAEEQGYADICAAEPAGDQPAQTRQGAPLTMKQYLTASVGNPYPWDPNVFGPLGYGSV